MLIVRRLEPQDALDDLIDLSKAFFAEYAVHHQRFFEICDLRNQDIRHFFLRSLDGDDGATFIALVDGRVVGYITVFVRERPGFYAIKEVGSISGLMVHRTYRRAGIGSRLLDEAFAFFKGRGLRYFTVYTAAVNHAAIKFYERNGLAQLHVTLIGETSDDPLSPGPHHTRRHKGQ